jgi:ABC-2 type transport system ATP-binding protein
VSAVRFAAICKSFGDKSVLDDLDFAVERAEVYGLLGPNGSGKSTAINILCNLLDPDSGTVEIVGKPAARVARNAVGICPQEIALYRDLYPAENLRFFADLYGLPKADAARRVAELMQLFALEPFARTRASALSGGWQRRLNIAVALVHSPDVLVLDEPTSAVDVEARHELWQTIEALKKQGVTILLTTHHLDEAEQLCSRIGIMKNGRIAKEGTVPELLSLVPAKAIALVEVSDTAAVLARASKLGWGVRHYAGKIGCLLPQQVSLEEVVRALSGINASSVSLQRVSLEHAYIEVMHEGSQPSETSPRQLVRELATHTS